MFLTLLQAEKAEKKKLIIVSVSPQSIASLAAKYKLTMEQAMMKLTGFLKDLGNEQIT